MKGKLIALEGLDGCGKSTHSRLLGNWLQFKDCKVCVTDEPTDNPIGKIIKQNLHEALNISIETEALLFASDRSIHVSNIIKPALDDGKIVITERYIHSSLAYQSARGLSIEWIEIINKPAINPDITIIIDVPAEICLKRMKLTRRLDEFEKNLELQKRVREKYREISKGEDILIVNGNREVDTVQEDIRENVEKALHINLS